MVLYFLIFFIICFLSLSYWLLLSCLYGALKLIYVDPNEYIRSVCAVFIILLFSSFFKIIEVAQYAVMLKASGSNPGSGK